MTDKNGEGKSTLCSCTNSKPCSFCLATNPEYYKWKISKSEEEKLNVKQITDQKAIKIRNNKKS